MRPQRGRIAGYCLLAGLAALTGVSLWLTSSDKLETFLYQPIGIMGTETSLTAVVEAGREARARDALQAAEAALRDVEAHMSSWLERSEVSLLNEAPAGRSVPLSSETMDLLRRSSGLARQTQGCFDVTCRPIVELWKRSGRENRLPTDAEIALARGDTGWRHIELLDGGARKRIDGAGVDLGGVAKGYAIDKAAEAMRAAGAVGGVVDVGGDVRCFGRRADGGTWKIGIRNPFKTDEIFARLAMNEGAVCTSGNYFRSVTIAGRRYSHIVDPRTGRPVDAAASVTVVAANTTDADAWATGLSVLGSEGLKLLGAQGGIEAMIIVGGPGDYQLHVTDGFKKLLADELPAPRQPKTGTNHP